MTAVALHPTAQVLWKFPLLESGGEVAMPRGAQVLAVVAEGCQAVLVAAVCPDNAFVNRTFAVVRSGEDLPDNRVRTFLGTVLLVAAAPRTPRNARYWPSETLHGDRLSVHVLELDAAPAEPVIRVDASNVDGELMRVSAGIHRK